MKTVDWNERYSAPGFTYGTAPNVFLVSMIDRIPRGKILSLAEGEGRNAVYLASLGYDVTAVDASEVGLGKARKLAAERGVTITALQANLAEFIIEPGQWDGIISCYCHLPPSIRTPLHRSVVAGLKPGGVLVMEGFSTAQLAYDTGGPKSLEMLFPLDTLKQELAGLNWLHAVETVRDVREGRGHTGMAAVVQLLGLKG